MDFWFIDYEARCALDLTRSTVSLWTSHSSAKVLIAAIAPLDRSVPVYAKPQLSGHELPGTPVSWGSFDPAVYANTEKGRATSRWFDCQQLSLYCGLPASVDGAARALGHSVTKDKRGKKLIELFCKPNGYGEFNEPEDYLSEFRAFVDYARADVEVMRNIFHDLAHVVPEWIRLQSQPLSIVQRMNARGAPVDTTAAVIADTLVEAEKPKLAARCFALTGLTSTQTGALAQWCGVPNMQRVNLEEWVRDTERFTPEQREVMQIRLASNYPSTAKLSRMVESADEFGFVRDQFLYNGAHTSRLTSWGVQFHNMKKPDPDASASTSQAFFDALAAGDPIPDLLPTISKNIRGFVKAPPRYKLLVSDYSQIECRVLAWLAGEEKLLKAFRAGADVYKMMGGNIFNLVWMELAKNSIERKIGKVVVLGAGYQLGVIGLMRNAALQWGLELDEDTADTAIYAFRRTFSQIVEFWWALEDALFAIARREKRKASAGPITFKWDDRDMFVECILPSGHAIRYLDVKIERVRMKGRDDTEYEKDAIAFMSRSPGGLVRDYLYGGKLAENITQAVSLHIMMHGMANLEALGYEPIMSVHDEVVSLIADEHIDDHTQAAYDAALCHLPAWAQGVPIAAEGAITERFGK